MSADEQKTRCPQCGKEFPPTVRICPDDGSVLEHPTATPSHIGTVLDGKYRLDSLLAEGGMGSVYKATHVMLGKTVAIKLIKPAIDVSPEIVRRFQREARATTALNHPNIIAVNDLGQTPDGTLYIAMEFIDGPSLKTVIQQTRAIAPARTIALLRQVASALSVAHKHGIIHRDLKPQNIMLTKSHDGAELVKLVDFGIAKTLEEGATQLTQAGHALGTPYYMSPEQIEGREVDARSDLYALGIILYEMLVGEVPFSDQSTPAVLVKQLKERPARPSIKNPNVSPALEAVALRCLEKDPTQRYQTAEEFMAALDEAGASMSQVGDMPTIPMRARAAAPSTAAEEATMPRQAAVSASGAADQPTVPRQAAAATAQPVAPGPSPSPAASVPRNVDTGTRPTVARPAVAPDAQFQPSGKAGLVAVLVAVLALAGVAGGYYWWMNRQAPPAATEVAQTEPPKSTPAMAPQDTPTPAAAPTPSPDATASAPGATATPPAATPSAPSVPAPSSSATPAERPSMVNKPSASGSSKPAAPAAAGGTAVPRSPAPAATQSASTAGAPSRQAAAQPAASTSATPSIPDNAAVYFGCAGAPEVCSVLRSTVNDALEKAGYRPINSPARADIAVTANAAPVEERVSQQFGTTFAVRTYSIELDGEAPKLGESVSMPPATTVSYDQSVGRERLNEKARLVAGDVVERVNAFVKKKRGA